MNRVALGIEYDGSDFHGWQHQTEVSSIQCAVEAALSQVASHPITVVCAGRTDRGVHATAQVVHFNTLATRSERAWVMGANTILPSTIRILWARLVPDTFDARRSALLRRYRYFLYNHPIRPSLLQKQVGWYYRSLSASLMSEAAKYWIGEHDFSSFRAAGCQSKSPIRRLTAVDVQQIGDLIIIDIAANAFLHHMVRNMVGTLLKIGCGKADPHWAKEVLEARDRRKACITAAPNGLYLVAVEYPKYFDLPENTVLGPWFLSPSNKQD